MSETTWIIAEIFAGLALLTVLGAAVGRWLSPPSRRNPTEILNERYARGELSNNEYRQMAENLGIAVPHGNDQPVRPVERATEARSDADRAAGS